VESRTAPHAVRHRYSYRSGQAEDPHAEDLLHAGVLGIYEAFGLELLAGRKLRGRSAGQSLLESLKVTGVDPERIGRLSAFHELFELLSNTGEKGRRTILLRLVGDVDGSSPQASSR